MKMPARLLALLAPTLLAVAFAAVAAGDKQVVWKLVDKKEGHYADKEPPKGFAGQVTRIEVDLRANRATLVNVGESSPPVLLPLTAPELKR
jgi:hypothetical protein